MEENSYFRRTWRESRGDEFDCWGTSIWYLAVGQDRYPLRQVEVYADGTILKYDQRHTHDRFGGLGDQQLDLDEFAPYEISSAEFEAAWCRPGARNR